MEMARENDVYTAGREAAHCHRGAPNQLPGSVFREVKGMVGDHDLEDVCGQGAQPSARPRHLFLIDAAALEREGACRIDAEHRDLIVGVERLQVRSDGALIVRKGVQEAGDDIVERHVVVARDHDHRSGQTVEEGTCHAELRAAGTLGEIAGNRHEVRGAILDARDQGRDERRFGIAEVQVG